MTAYEVAIILLLVLNLGILVYLVSRRARLKVEPSAIKANILESLRELELDRALGSVQAIGSEMRDASQRLLRLLEIKRERFAYGELQLEELLKDGLGRGLFAMREEIKGLGTPDAHIRSAEGIICLDCKFPFENYRATIESSSEEERNRARRDFLRDLKGHVESVAKYVRPDQGTVAFAFLFVPAEAVYQYLAQEEPGLLREASQRGVILVSPATLYAGLHLVKLGIRGKELTERGQEIERKIESLRRPLERLGRAWNVTKGHIINAHKSRDEVDHWYEELSQQHEGVVGRQDEATE